jgi:ankyrin repeat protein
MKHKSSFIVLAVLVLVLMAGCASTTAVPSTATPTLTAAEVEALGGQLCKAVEDRSFAEVQRLVDAGADTNTICSEEGVTPLILSARVGSVEILKLLIETGADLNHQTNGFTALNIAVALGEADKVRALTEAGADVSINSDRFNMLFNVAERGHVEIVQLLLDAGVSPHLLDEYSGADNVTVLMAAAMGGDPATVQLLIETGVDVNARDSYGDHALNWNLYFDHPDIEVVRLLLDAGSDLNYVGYGGRTTLDFAIEHGDQDIVDLLVEAGALTAVEVSNP